MSIHEIIALSGFVLAVFFASFFLIALYKDKSREAANLRIRREVRRNFLPQRIFSVEEFGRIERDFPGLVEVIVVCHMVENPSAALREAVLDNFKNGVRYRFCVSQSNFAAARKIYTGYFEDIFGIAKAECALDSKAEICGLDLANVFEVNPLRREWTSWPYVFFVHLTADNENAVSAFRGDQEREGIADHYVQLQPTEAKAILNAVNMATDNTHELIEELVDSAAFIEAPRDVEAA